MSVGDGRLDCDCDVVDHLLFQAVKTVVMKRPARLAIPPPTLVPKDGEDFGVFQGIHQIIDLIGRGEMAFVTPVVSDDNGNVNFAQVILKHLVSDAVIFQHRGREHDAVRPLRPLQSGRSIGDGIGAAAGTNQPDRQAVFFS